MINKPSGATPGEKGLVNKTHRMTSSDLVATRMFSPTSGSGGPLTGRSITDGEKRIVDFEKRIESLKGSTLKYSNIVNSNFNSMVNLRIVNASRESSTHQRELQAWKMQQRPWVSLIKCLYLINHIPRNNLLLSISWFPFSVKSSLYPEEFLSFTSAQSCPFLQRSLGLCSYFKYASITSSFPLHMTNIVEISSIDFS